MALTIDATVSGVDSNSYVTIDEADEYLDYRYDNVAWASATDDEKVIALVMACEKIEQFSFYGVRCSTAQRLSFPRYFSDVVKTEVDNIVLYKNNAIPIIPKNVKKVQILEANEILKLKSEMASGVTTRADLIKQGVTEVVMGENSEKYDKAGLGEWKSSDAQRLMDGIIRRGY